MKKIKSKNQIPARKLLRSGIFLGLFIFCINANAQSVGYYPWNGLLSVSTNPAKSVWCDFRLQTNTLFGSLSTEILPMVNIKRAEYFQVYVGGGVRFNFIGVLANQTKNVVEGYSLNIGTRIAPFKAVPNVSVTFELSPYVVRKFDSGVLKSNFGIVYTFRKKG
ncbi:hypothetical protein [Runella sp.]|jgi:hypothetical protein|uniref:hypothetical protein n=1 Tax=Runella sp. TaxID=1960881 RepID=UPI002630CE1F|nr:hypothetical protein [Runella sp.]